MPAHSARRECRAACFSGLAPTPRDGNGVVNAGPQQLQEPEVSGQVSVAPAALHPGHLCADRAKEDGECTLLFQPGGVPLAKKPKLQSSQVTLWEQGATTSLLTSPFKHVDRDCVPCLTLGHEPWPCDLLWPMKRKRKGHVSLPGGSI